MERRVKVLLYRGKVFDRKSSESSKHGKIESVNCNDLKGIGDRDLVFKQQLKGKNSKI